MVGSEVKCRWAFWFGSMHTRRELRQVGFDEGIGLSAINDLVARLVKTANQTDTLSLDERRQLLERVVLVIHQMRITVTAPSARIEADKMFDLAFSAVAMGTDAKTPEEVRQVLLTAADMIRTMHIILDGRGG